MIKVHVDDKQITISGHANYAPKGKDIVCAYFTGVLDTTSKLLHETDYNIVRNVTLGETWTIILFPESRISNAVILNMLEIFMQLSSQYPNNVQVIDMRGLDND